METIQGIYASAKVYMAISKMPLEQYAESQVKMICDNPAAKGSQICVMPDVHPGKTGPVGLTMTVGERILPGLVGVDIGCGMTLARLRDRRIEFQKMDSIIRERVPAGFSIRRKAHHFAEKLCLSELCCFHGIREGKALLSLGTLGGGNHFIEADRDNEGNLYILIHSGSRHLGVEVAEYYMREGQRRLKADGIQIPYELSYLEGELRENYLHDIRIVQDFAEKNREAILYELVKGMRWKMEEMYSCRHNYIDSYGDGLILRKGAISAKDGEPVIIPINMRDGVILGTGLGNPKWNCSAPHGAGRIMKREDVKTGFTVSSFKKEMKGIYSTCIDKNTLDEAPFAYRGIDEIAGAIEDTVRIEKYLKPIYSFKAGGR